MSDATQAYRGFTEDFKSYRVDDKTFKINEIPFSTMSRLRKELIALNDLAPTVKGVDRFRLQERTAALSKDIIVVGLQDFNYDEMIDKYGESEINGIAGDVIGFLSVKRSERELSLLTRSSEEKPDSSNSTPN